MVGLNPDVIAAHGAPTIRLLNETTSVIPVTMVGVAGDDPLRFGSIDSFARPGRNATGTATLEGEVMAKVLDLLHEVAALISSVSMFINPTNEGAVHYVRAAREATSKFGISVQVLEVRSPTDFDAAFVAIAAAHTQAILVATEGLIQSQRKRMQAILGREATVG